MIKKLFLRFFCGVCLLTGSWMANANEADCTLGGSEITCGTGHLALSTLCKYTTNSNCTQLFTIAATSDQSEIEVTAKETLDLFHIHCLDSNGHWENLPKTSINSGTIGNCVNDNNE